MSKEKSRWWEFYLVRYFVGTVVGTLIVLVLIHSPESLIGELAGKKIKDIPSFDFKQLWLYGFIGLAYCYVSSAPILVFHGYRGLFSKSGQSQPQSPEGRLAERKQTRLTILYIFVFVILAAIILFCWIGLKFQAHPIILMLILFFLQGILIIIGFRSKRIFEYYSTLCEFRAKADDTDGKKQSSEYVESYRHLREHGNAFLILLMELILGTILFKVDNLVLLVTVIFLWILPASMIWFVGTMLEFDTKNIGV